MPRTTYNVGELIENRYRVLEAIETGGMATLYRVTDEAKENEILALKAAKLDLPEEEIAQHVESFKREFQLLAQVRHPNLVSVYEYGITTKGELYFTMEWLDGKSLDPKSRRSSLSSEDIVPIIVQVCRALNYLHARGILHGDLKPSNVFLCGDTVKLIDFGVSLEFRNREARGSFYTPYYSAPEVKERRVVDQRADLYSLGAVWYSLLTGQPPLFARGDERLIHYELSDLLETLLEPAGYAEIVARLMSILPQERYVNANEVIEAINAVGERKYELETPETAKSYALRANFTGRETELEALKRAWSSAQGGLILIGGASGVGKTRLVEEFVIHAQMEGARVAQGRCLGTDSLAYRPWREILRVLIRHVEAEREEKVRQNASVLSLILPELRQRDYLKDITLPVELTPQAAQHRLNDAALRILREAASLRHTIIVIEDVHWADESTLTFLSALARVQELANLLICATYQDHEIGEEHPLAAMKGERVQRIALKPLQAETCTNLVASMLGTKELPRLFTQRILQVSGGNPFFAQELIREMAENGVVLKRAVEGWDIDQGALQEARLPESIHQVVERRLERLSPETRQVLKLAAVIGPIFWDNAIEELSQISRERALFAIQESLRSGLVAEQERSAFEPAREYLFVNPAVREVNYENMDANLRREAHLKIADWFIARSGSRDDEHVGLIGGHLERAGDFARAAVYLQRAGKQAASQFANDSALDYFNRALALLAEEDLAGRYDLLLKQWNVYDAQGNRDAQKRDMAALDEIAESMNDDQRRLEALSRRADFSLTVSDYSTAVTVAQKMIDLATQMGDQNNIAKGYLAWGRALWYQGGHESARTQLETALNVVGDAPHIRADILRNIGNVCADLGDYTESIRYYELSLQIYREVGDRRCEGGTLNNIAAAFDEEGDHEQAFVYFELSRQIYDQTGDRWGQALALVNLGNVNCATGNYAESNDNYQAALALCREIDEGWGIAYALARLAYLSRETGDVQNVYEFGRQALRLSRALASRSLEADALMVLGHAALESGELSEAVSCYEQSAAIYLELGQPTQSIEALTGIAQANLLQGNYSAAMQRAEEILERVKDRFVAEKRVYLTLYRVLSANEDPRADSVLRQGYDELQRQAERLRDAKTRRSFFENVRAHRELVEEYNRLQSGS